MDHSDHAGHMASGTGGVMELVDNSVIALTPRAMDAHLSDGLFWYALLGGFAVAFLITTPVNKWMIGRGKGHAVVHSLH